MQRPGRWLNAGLFLTTSATLLLELLDARLLSVLTWYHLSFAAVSLAMLGMAAGAVLVFLAGARLGADGARLWLGRASLALALAIPLTHLGLLRMRITTVAELSVAQVRPLATATLLLTIPFLLSGVVVAIALTRVGGRIGVLYGCDLLGAAVGCMLLVPLLHWLDMMSAVLVTGAFAAAGALCFCRFAGRGAAAATAGGAVIALLAAAAANVGSGAPLDVAFPRGGVLDRARLERSEWNAYSQVSMAKPVTAPPFFWGPGRVPDDLSATLAWMLIDGEAGTVVTRWDGDPASLSWVQYDVTSLPYHLRSGDVGVIGVGGGRDVLSAIWSGASSVTAVELNEIFVDALEGHYRDFAKLADREGVELVHDEARSYLTRSTRSFDVLQMSLVDTWAATGAGAFTLTENALYTLEAWKLFLSRLAPDGIFSTSRWFSSQDVSETSRLLSLGVGALLARGAERPSDHLALVARRQIATLLVSPTPFSEADLARLHQVSERYWFDVIAAPDRRPLSPRLRRIAASTSPAELAAAVSDPHFDLSPPTDDRPFFFNMLKPGSFYRLRQMVETGELPSARGVIWGNLLATTTLVALFVIAVGLVACIILVPLLWSGAPRMGARSFVVAAWYFAAIGYGFMSIQIPFLQRFSVFVGHPIYTFSVILFTMILFAGIGSLLSDRIALEGRRWHLGVPLSIAGLIGLLLLALPPLLDAGAGLGLMGRCAIVVAVVAPLSTLLGFCFPIGMRLVARISTDATAWMWGVNGAFGVLASILAVVVSMAWGIHANLLVAAGLYLLLAIPARLLARAALA